MKIIFRIKKTSKTIIPMAATTGKKKEIPIIRTKVDQVMAPGITSKKRCTRRSFGSVVLGLGKLYIVLISLLRI
jgi:hypothetical protein